MPIYDVINADYEDYTGEEDVAVRGHLSIGGVEVGRSRRQKDKEGGKTKLKRLSSSPLAFLKRLPRDREIYQMWTIILFRGIDKKRVIV